MNQIKETNYTEMENKIVEYVKLLVPVDPQSNRLRTGVYA